MSKVRQGNQWGEMAHTYDLTPKLLIKKRQLKTLAEVINMNIPQSNTNVLSFGAGDAAIFPFLRARGLEPFGVDITVAMREKAIGPKLDGSAPNALESNYLLFDPTTGISKLRVVRDQDKPKLKMFTESKNGNEELFGGVEATNVVYNLGDEQFRMFLGDARSLLDEGGILVITDMIPVEESRFEKIGRLARPLIMELLLSITDRAIGIGGFMKKLNKAAQSGYFSKQEELAISNSHVRTLAQMREKLNAVGFEIVVDDIFTYGGAARTIIAKKS